MKRIPLFATRNQLLILTSTVALIYGCKMYFKTTKDNFQSKAESESVARGKNLVFTICAGCHYDPATKKFIGKSLNDLPKIAGHLYSANLTHSTTNGIPPHYSDAELFYLLKTGISKSGKFMPYMMKPMMADQDVNDIIVFLRSNDESLAAADTTVGKTHINFIGKMGLRIATKPQPYNKDVPRPDENNSVAYGKYLVGIIGCYHCHSKKVLGLNFLDPEKSKGYLQGGIKLKDPKGKHLRGPNLTPDTATGIGHFTQMDFRRAIQDGITPSGDTLSPPMPRFKQLTEQQVAALYSYLHGLTPVHHKVKGQKK
jgi:mono/diheme cytochrome c family protein